MLYRTAGQFKTSYEADHALFPVRQDAWLLDAILLLAFVVFPLSADDFVFQALLIPVLIYSLAALGLNMLTGYAGQFSLGTGAFMGVGAYACYKLITIFPDLNLIVAIAAVGIFLGRRRGRLRPAIAADQGLLPRHRHAGRAVLPRLAVREMGLALQLRLFRRDPGAEPSRCSASTSLVRMRARLSNIISCWRSSPLITLAAINVTRGRIGRIWKAVRDMDIAAELVGINLMKAKLSAFAVSSYVVGVAGALFVFLWRGAAEPNLFDIPLSFRILFIAIIGGLGSVLGNFLGAILIVALPVLLNIVPGALGMPIASAARRASQHHDHRRADHPVPDRRTARPAPVLGDHPGEADHVAVSALRILAAGLGGCRKKVRPDPPPETRAKVEERR